MSFFISDAVAYNEAISKDNPYSIVIILLIFGIIFYFTIIRPHQKRAKEHKKLMNSISKGDEVMTTGGLIGRVVKIADTGYIYIALNETNEVVVKRDFIAAILPKGTMKTL